MEWLGASKAPGESSAGISISFGLNKYLPESRADFPADTAFYILRHLPGDRKTGFWIAQSSPIIRIPIRLKKFCVSAK